MPGEIIGSVEFGRTFSYIIVNCADIRNACGFVSKAHEKMREVVGEGENFDGTLSVIRNNYLQITKNLIL